MRFMGFFGIIPVSILLTISYFVLFVNRKAETAGLRAFGRMVAVLLWIAATLIFIAAGYIVATGHHPMEPLIREMMQGQMHGG